MNCGIAKWEDSVNFLNIQNWVDFTVVVCDIDKISIMEEKNISISESEQYVTSYNFNTGNSMGKEVWAGE